MKKIFLFLLAFLTLSLSGCGQTNALQWATPKPNISNTEAARQALDEAKYDKALSLVKDDRSVEGRIIYAEALLGKADLDLASILEALDDDTLPDNAIIRLDKLMHRKNNTGLIIEAGDIFLNITPDNKSDQLIGALAVLAAHTANLKQAFDPSDDGLQAVIASLNILDDVSSEYKAVCGGSDNVTEAIRYVNRAGELLALATNNKDLTKAFREMQKTMTDVNYAITVAGGISPATTWGIVQAIFGL
ncbi:MAG: hypothetical protein LBD99_02480 [Candidatus Margulisbacteria bacterium]|jgi:predicted small lipoprotein YifL|nr:hypothetical protein [Candidatus Margulisiibacteriota bacterium]